MISLEEEQNSHMASIRQEILDAEKENEDSQTNR